LIASSGLLKCAGLLLLVGPVNAGWSQTFQVNPANGQTTGTKADQKSDPSQQLGWGSNIQNARLARAAQLAIASGNHGQALDYAERAAQATPNDPQAWFLLGYAARLDGRYGRAVDAYSRGLKLSGGSVEGLSGLAQTYSLEGRSDEAIRILHEILTASPGRSDDMLLLGDLYLRSGKYPEALDALTRAERAAPSARSELLLAVTYQHLGQLEQANRFLLLAKSRSPNNPDVERSLAGYYRSTGDYKRAIEELQAIPSPKPDVVAELAYTYGLAGKPEDAARLYMQAANALPRDLGLQLSAAQAQVSLGNNSRALPFLDRAQKIDPNYYRLHAIRGEIAQDEERQSDAASEYLQAVQHLPASPPEGPLYGIQLHMDLEALYTNLDRPDEAHQQLQLAQTEIAGLNEQGADRASFLRLRGVIKMTAGDTTGALADMQASLALTPNDQNSLQIDGDLLVKLGRTGEGIDVLKRVLTMDPRSRGALTSLGYASRITGNNSDAEKYFTLLAKDYPTLYAPWLALGDMYASLRQYRKALVAYERGYALAPENSSIVAGGLNASLEQHDLKLAGTWVHRVRDTMQTVPVVMREEERYLYFTGDYQKSADIGRKAIQILPRDREVVVYLGYDLLHLEDYPELMALTQKYENTFPQEADIPLLAGYVYKHDGQLQLALEQFTEALHRDPTVATAYINRGFILNDLHRPEEASADFRKALQLRPDDGETHLGLAFAELNLHHPETAIRESEIAQKFLGDSEAVHVIRATAYGREHLLGRSATEYRAALRFNPRDGSLYLGLANILFAQQQYRAALNQLQLAEKLLPANAEVYALEARAYADLADREQALQSIQLAEKYAAQLPASTDDTGIQASGIYVETGEALSTLGDDRGAMERFGRALDSPGSDRVGVRLAIARLMAGQNRVSEAERQVALAQLEVEAGDTAPMSGDQDIEAAGVFQQLHEYQLSQTYLGRANVAGASNTTIRIARANNYLALGDTARAAAELAAVKHTGDDDTDYAFILAQAGVYQQEHQSTEALSSFAQAASAAGEDQTAQQSLLLAGASEGYRINQKLSLLGNVIVQPIFEDSTVYVLDAKLASPLGPVAPTDLANLPPPRSSIETDGIVGYHLHLGNLPNAGGYFEVRNAQGSISIPYDATSSSQVRNSSVVSRNTTDYALNFGVSPTVHIGTNAVTLNTGVQGTIQRDAKTPVQLDQNLFRAFTYGSTTSFLDAVSATGYFIYETGPFTNEKLSSRTLTGAIDFRVGSPWSKTALVTGWGATDQKFTSSVTCAPAVGATNYPCGLLENYFTTSYIGLSHDFSSRLRAEGIIEDLRAWRTVPFSPIGSGIAQVLRPAGTVEFSLTKNLRIEANGSYESARSFHVYDMTQNGFALSYTRPLSRIFNDKTGEEHLRYPLSLSLGLQEETFPNFSHGSNQQFRPYASLTLF
jgi:tetratricopeptide (TPR) repeat protein